MLICPICRAPLHPTNGALVCPLGHSFDLAREGYVNLLRTNHPGDTREMLAARRRFLERGHFAPIADRISDLALSHLTSRSLDSRDFEGRVRSIVDAGCGEGYYLGRLQSHLGGRAGMEIQYVGIDSSRDACRLAARRYGDMCFAVSDLKDLIPVADRSVDLLIDIFAPRSSAEFARVLRPSGLVLVVIPQSSHLGELRSTVPLIGIEDHKADHVIGRFKPGLRLTHREALEYELRLEHDAIADLVEMSPSHRHLTAPLDPVSGSFQVTVAIEILAFKHDMGGSRSEQAT